MTGSSAITAPEFREILDTSSQSIHLFFDDNYKLCRARFATLFSYDSPALR